MGKVYSKTYNTNYANISKASAPLSVAVSTKQCFRIPFPSEGFLEKLIVYQATGTSCAFEVELLNSAIPYAPGAFANAATPADNLAPYRIQVPATGPLAAGAGGVISLSAEGFGIGFRNIDGSFTANQRYVYLLINPISAAGTTTWNVTIQCRTDVG